MGTHDPSGAEQYRQAQRYIEQIEGFLSTAGLDEGGGVFTIPAELAAAANIEREDLEALEAGRLAQPTTSCTRSAPHSASTLPPSAATWTRPPCSRRSAGDCASCA